MVRVERVELSSHPWEGYIIAVIRYPRKDFYAYWLPFNVFGADKRARTADLRFTKAPLYQLSYIGTRR